MANVTLDELRHALPDLGELRPLFDHLIARSEPDQARTWSGSGLLGTLGSRVLSREDVLQGIADVAAREGAHLADLYDEVGAAAAALATGDRPEAARRLLRAAALEEERDHPERAEAYATSAYLVARDSEDRRLGALALRRSARAARARGALAEALERYAEAHAMGRALGDARGAAEAAVGAGNVLEDQGRWPEANGWYESALEALEGSAEPAPERWHALLCLHIVARSQGALDESLPWLEKAQQAAKELGDPDAAPFIGNARGQLLAARGAFREAEALLRDALQAMSGTRARVTIRLNLAESLLAQGRSLDAAEQAREAEREAIRSALVPKLPEVYRLLGRVAAAEGNPDAFVLFERALEIVRDRDLPALEEALTLQAYAEAEERGGNLETAGELREQATTRFQALGIRHLRHPWADVFGPEPDHNALPGKEQEHDD